METHQHSHQHHYRQQLREQQTNNQYPISKQKSQRPYDSQMKMSIAGHSDNDRSSGELRALDCNLTSLCDHIQLEGFNNGTFSDIVVHAMGSTYLLHRLILSRSSYFRNMLHGPWKEATASVVSLQIDDNNVNAEAIAIALAYMYGHHPKLNDNNAFRVLAAASFLDLQDLCVICTDFIISELWTSNFLAYQVFAENQDYGIHGERVRSACWGYLCQSGGTELKEVLPNLSSQTLLALLTSNELWTPSEEKRFELALYALLTKCALANANSPGQESSSTETEIVCQNESTTDQWCLISGTYSRSLEANMGNVHQVACPQPHLGPGYPRTEPPSRVTSSFSGVDRNACSCCVSMPVFPASRQCKDGEPIEGPSEEALCYQFNNNGWISECHTRHCTPMNSTCDNITSTEGKGSCNMHVTWGGRLVRRRQLKGHPKANYGVGAEDYDTFINIFEGGSLLFCNMSFEALLHVRKQLEELGFPCKAVNDGLWLQMLLSQRVEEIAAHTCKTCCVFTCQCRQPFAFSHGVATSGYYMQAPDQQNASGNTGNLYVADPGHGDGNGAFRPVRVNVRGSNDGLAGIGRGATFVPASAWPPTRFVFSRVPFGVGNRSGQQSLANDDSDGRTDQNGDLSGDGLTALVALSEGGRASVNSNGGQGERGFDMDMENSLVGTSSGGPCQMTESVEQDTDNLWENAESTSITLDLKTPLSHFPPFRFGVEFEDVHRLCDGQVKHSLEAFYAGSLWKISVQAFNDEDPQGRRTLGLFIHRRKAEIGDPLRKVHIFVDSREKVMARYQLICPSKREVMVFGNFKQAGNLLPKAPKGWGWRSAILFDELPDLLQNGCLRVAAVVQLV